MTEQYPDVSLIELHARLREVLVPLGIEVGPEVLNLWRDQHAHGRGPLRALACGDATAVDGLVVLLGELRSGAVPARPGTGQPRR